MSEVVQQFEKAPSLNWRHTRDTQPDEFGFSRSKNTSKPIKRKSKLTIGGLVYVAVTVFLAIGAINSQNNLLFWLFGVSIATLIVSGLFSGNALMRVRLNAQVIPDGTAGQAVYIRYSISNRSKFFPLFAAMISEIDLGSSNDQSADGVPKPAGIIHLGPRQSVRASSLYIPTRRGQHTCSKVRLSTRFPFGLLQKELIFESPRHFMVMPYQLKIRPELIRVVQGHGEEMRKRTEMSGMSSEFWGMREYTPGDPKRAIAWKQSARHQKLIVIEHAQPIATKLWVWILNPDPRHTNHEILFERSVALAATLMTQGYLRGVPVGLWAPKMGLRIAPAMGKAHMIRSLRALCGIEISERAERDPAPNTASTDDVVAIGLPAQQYKVPSSFRYLDTSNPSQWLVDPGSLPDALKVKKSGGEDS